MVQKHLNSFQTNEKKLTKAVGRSKTHESGERFLKWVKVWPIALGSKGFKLTVKKKKIDGQRNEWGITVLLQNTLLNYGKG